MKKIISIYRSKKREGMFLYLNKSDKVDSIPDALKSLFGKPEKVLDMLLTADRKLAKVDTDKVLEGIDEKGFFLQMPPADEENLLQQHRREQGLDINS